jgi:hypothetical protein
MERNEKPNEGELILYLLCQPQALRVAWNRLGRIAGQEHPAITPFAPLRLCVTIAWGGSRNKSIRHFVSSNPTPMSFCTNLVMQATKGWSTKSDWLTRSPISSVECQ